MQASDIHDQFLTPFSICLMNAVRSQAGTWERIDQKQRESEAPAELPPRWFGRSLTLPRALRKCLPLLFNDQLAV